MAIAQAQNPSAMAMAADAGRLASQTGRILVKVYASASFPVSAEFGLIEALLFLGIEWQEPHTKSGRAEPYHQEKESIAQALLAPN